MKSESNSFYLKKIVDVHVDIESEIICAKLEYGDFGLPTLRIDTLPDTTEFYNHVRDNEELTCTTLSEGEIITLHGITLGDSCIFADYLTKGKMLPRFDKIELHLTGLSVWIEGRRGFQRNSDRLERDISTERFSEPFSFRSQSYFLTTNFHINTHNESPVKCHFEFEHTLVIQKKEGNFYFTECRELAHELRNLFSLLTGHALSVRDVWVFSHANPAQYQWLYFPSVLYAKYPLQYDFHAVCDFSSLIEGKKWEGILSKYFGNDTFRNIWNRLVPSYGEMGAWEYDILSRVIILEIYAGVKTADRKLKLSRIINRDFMKALHETIESFSASRDLSSDDRIVYEGMAKAILSTKNTSLPTLREKYDALMEQLSTSFRKAISFTDSDFNRIKNLRDSTAHGDEYERHSQGNDISYEMQLSDRLLVLLMCFVYLELGFSENEIASFFQKSHCSFIRNANLNMRELDRLSGGVTFIKLTKPPREIILKNYDMVILDHSKEDGKWYLNEEITENLHVKWHKSGIPTLLDYIKSIYSQKVDEDFEILNKAYIESGGIETEHFGAVIIKH